MVHGKKGTGKKVQEKRARKKGHWKMSTGKRAQVKN